MAILQHANRAVAIQRLLDQNPRQITWVNLFPVLQYLDGKQEGEHELVSLKQAAADIDEQRIGECLIQSSAAFLNAFRLRQTGQESKLRHATASQARLPLAL